MNQVIDARQRSLALSPERSFAVTAPAGSGKTELLTRRVLTLLAQVERPEEILAITFTRKAANEMRQRIMQALQDAQLDPPEDPYRLELWQIAQRALLRDQQQQWQLLDNPNRLRLQTIDSFCMSLVRQLPVISGLGTEASVAEQPQLLYQEAARNLLARLLETGTVSDDLAELLIHLDNNTTRIEALFCNILAKREQWLRHLVGNRTQLEAFKRYLESCLECLIEETLEQSQAELQHWEPQLVAALNFSSQHLPANDGQGSVTKLQTLPPCSAEALEQWQQLAQLLLTKSGGWRARLTKNEGFPAATKGSDKESFKAAKSDALALITKLAENPYSLKYLREIRSLPAPQYDQQQWQLLGRLAKLLPILVAELMLIFREQGQVDYQQITISALEALGHDDAPSDIALLLDYRLRHILVDEFQDTASVQFALLQRLSDGWQAGDGRTFFIVGDGMQSCYGFRDANVGLFLAARQFGIGNVSLEPLDLKVNFRSSQGLVSWVNQTFRTAFPEQDDIARGAVKYSESSAFDQQQEHTAVQFYACNNDPERQLEAQQVIDLIQQAQQQSAEDSLAILVRNRSHLKIIIQHLHQAGIAWFGVDIEPLARRAIINDLLALTRAMLNPSDKTAWLAILRAPWCGLKLADLELLGGFNSAQSTIWEALNNLSLISHLSHSAQLSLARLNTILQASLAQRLRKPLRQWIEGIWLALGGPATAQSSNDLIQVDAYFELLEQHECGGRIDELDQFNEVVTGIYAKPAAACNAVQVMTIHKAKGLEFDRVIVPGLDRTTRASGNELILWHERLSTAGEAQLLISPISGKGQDEDPLYRYLKQEQTSKDRLENTRLIYVAATRAVKQLSLLACIKKNPDSGEINPPPAASLLNCIWPELEQQAIILEPQQQALQEQSLAADGAAAFKLSHFSERWQLPELARGDLLMPYRGHEYQDTKLEQVEPSQQQWMANTVQGLLLDIASKGSETWDQSRLKELPRIIEQLYAMPGTINSNNAKQAVINTINTTLQDEQARWLLSGGHQQSVTNWQLTFNQAGSLYHLCIPLSFISQDIRWMIEFDMSTAQASEDIQNEYKLRLEQYARAVSQLETLPIKKAIYFPFLQKLEQLPEAD